MLANIDGNSLSTSLISTNVQITSLPIPDPDPIPEEDTTSPVVSIVSPSEGVVRNKVEIVVESFDESEISTLWVFLDGQMLGETSSSNITLIWDARKVKGDHEITAVAMDEFGI